MILYKNTSPFCLSALQSIMKSIMLHNFRFYFDSIILPGPNTFESLTSVILFFTAAGGTITVPSSSTMEEKVYMRYFHRWTCLVSWGGKGELIKQYERLFILFSLF